MTDKPSDAEIIMLAVESGVSVRTGKGAVKLARAVLAKWGAAHGQAPAGATKPTEQQILEAAEKAGLWPNTVHSWIPAFHRYHKELAKAQSAQAQPSTTPQSDPLQPLVALQEKAGMYADDFAPQADSVPKAQFDDPKVQAVYAILCEDAEPPKGEHWEGFAARRIVDALLADSVLEDALSDAVRVPLDSLHADAAYLIGRLREGSMPYARVIEIIRERIDAAKAAIRARAAQGDAQEPCPTCAALARTVMLDQVSFDRKPDCYGIRQITDDDGVEEWEDIRTSPNVAQEEANDMMATGRGELYEVVALYTTPPVQAVREPLTEAQLIDIFKAADSEDKGRWAIVVSFARAIEAAHGIKGGQHGTE